MSTYLRPLLNDIADLLYVPLVRVRRVSSKKIFYTSLVLFSVVFYALNFEDVVDIMKTLGISSGVLYSIIFVTLFYLAFTIKRMFSQFNFDMPALRNPAVSVLPLTNAPVRVSRADRRAIFRQTRIPDLIGFAIYEAHKNSSRPTREEYRQAGAKVWQERAYNIAQQKKIVAWHEAGHAVVGVACGIPTVEISTVQYDDIGGYTSFSAHSHITKQDGNYTYAWSFLTAVLGGIEGERAMNEGTHTSVTGCSGDIETAVSLAHQIWASELKIAGVDTSTPTSILEAARLNARTVLAEHAEVVSDMAQALIANSVLDVTAILALTKDIRK